MASLISDILTVFLSLNYMTSLSFKLSLSTRLLFKFQVSGAVFTDLPTLSLGPVEWLVELDKHLTGIKHELQFCYQVLVFYVKHIPGDIFMNVGLQSIIDTVACSLAGVTSQTIGTQHTMTISFLLATIGGVILVSSEQ
jgi:hypothetical protein